MFSYKRPIFFNKDLHNYCLKSTDDFIQNLIKKNEEERKLKNFKINLVTENSLAIPSSNSNFNPNSYIFSVFIFLSTSSFIYYFYNSKK